MPEPTRSGEPPVRWIDAEDGSHLLVIGPELLPVAEVVLKCGDIASEHQDRIAASWNACRDLTLEQIEAVRQLIDWFTIPSKLGTSAEAEVWKNDWHDLERLFPRRPT